MVQKKYFGFTIVELIVVIAVIGILTSIGVISFNGWRTRTAQNEVKSDLKTVVAAMETVRNFDGAYPSAPSIPANFKPSPNVTIVRQYGYPNTYCITGTSKTVSTVVYNVKNTNTEPQTGQCPASIQP